MGLNIKNEEVERLAADVAQLAHESKTEAIKQSLLLRKHKLLKEREDRIAELKEWLEREIYSKIPPELRGKPISKEERERILGYGPEGY